MTLKKLLAKTKVYIVVLLSALVLVVWMLALGSQPISGDHKPVRVVIARGTSAKEIAAVLKGKDLIRSSFVFSLTCRVNGAGARLKPGVYELNKAMSVPCIIDKLIEGQSLEVWVTVPEGFTIRQISDLLQAKQLARGNSFLHLTLGQGEDFSGFSFVQGESLEGYLFPDTYLVSREMSPEAVVKKMLDTFEQKVDVQLKEDVQRIANERLSAGEPYPEQLHKILTLASLVEREAKVPKDRPLVAAVMWNRLKKGMRLEVDATISYVPGESGDNKDRVLYTDLRSDSSYNTYKFAGLPPGPICNPGLASIKAVLNPAHVDYLFYVAKPDGSHVFTRTFQEHMAARRAIRSGKQ